MEPSKPVSKTEHIVQSAVRSAINGTVMMGLYYGLLFAAGKFGLFGLAVPALGTAMAGALVVISAVTLFGAVAASGLLGKHHEKAPARESSAGMEVSAPSQEIPIPMPLMDKSAAPVLADHAPEPTTDTPARNWSSRPDIAASTSRDRIAQILADGQSGISHAESIAAEQRAAAGAAPTLH